MAYSAGDIQVGYGVEGSSTFGTAVTPTNFIEIASESVKQTIDRVDSKGLRTARVLASKDKFTKGKVDVGGDVELEVQTRGLGLLLGHMLGATVTTTTASGGTNAKKHSFSMTAGETTNAKSLTWQIARTDIAGTRARFIYAGTKVQAWELSATAGEIVMCKLTLDGQSETVDTTTPTTASYGSTSVPLVFAGATLLVDGSAFECKSVQVKGENALKTDRYALGSLLKREQVQNGLRNVSGQIGCEFKTLTAYQYAVNGTVKSFQVKFESLDEIETGVKASLTITLPSIRFDGETPTANAGQIIEHNLNFVALDDESNADSPCVIEYVTLDATP